jgi:hypothetical protein
MSGVGPEERVRRLRGRVGESLHRLGHLRTQLAVALERFGDDGPEYAALLSDYAVLAGSIANLAGEVNDELAHRVVRPARPHPRVNVADLLATRTDNIDPLESLELRAGGAGGADEGGPGDEGGATGANPGGANPGGANGAAGANGGGSAPRPSVGRALAERDAHSDLCEATARALRTAARSRKLADAPAIAEGSDGAALGPVVKRQRTVHPRCAPLAAALFDGFGMALPKNE